MELKDIKETSPIELDENAVANNIDYETAFAWWVHDVLKKQDSIISKAKTNYWRTTHKYCVRLPNMEA